MNSIKQSRKKRGHRRFRLSTRQVWESSGRRNYFEELEGARHSQAGKSINCALDEPPMLLAHKLADSGTFELQWECCWTAALFQMFGIDGRHVWANAIRQLVIMVSLKLSLRFCKSTPFGDGISILYAPTFHFLGQFASALASCELFSTFSFVLNFLNGRTIFVTSSLFCGVVSALMRLPPVLHLLNAVVCRVIDERPTFWEKIYDGIIRSRWENNWMSSRQYLGRRMAHRLHATSIPRQFTQSVKLAQAGFYWMIPMIHDRRVG